MHLFVIVTLMRTANVYRQIVSPRSAIFWLKHRLFSVALAKTLSLSLFLSPDIPDILDRSVFGHGGKLFSKDRLLGEDRSIDE